MASRDMKNSVVVAQLLDVQDLDHTDTTTDYVDLGPPGYESAVFGVHVGALTGVDGSNYLTPVLQESDTTEDADFSDVDSSNIQGAFTVIDSTAEDSTIQYVGYAGSRRYVRVKFDYTGTGITAGYCGAWAILGDARTSPPVNPTTGTAS